MNLLVTISLALFWFTLLESTVCANFLKFNYERSATGLIYYDIVIKAGMTIGQPFLCFLMETSFQIKK